MAAAYELSDPALQGAYEVTLYQSGWRLGGKCASGRNAAHGERIEEHGLHIWFGFYDNAFDLIQRCYAELGRDWRTAFEPCHDVVLLDRRDGAWHARRWSFPPNDGVPGAGHDRSVRDVALRAFGWLRHALDPDADVLTPAGSISQRLRAHEAGFANLALAGDWTRNGICGGSVEAAVTSGRDAARATSGHPAVVRGLDGWLEAD